MKQMEDRLLAKITELESKLTKLDEETDLIEPRLNERIDAIEKDKPKRSIEVEPELPIAPGYKSWSTRKKERIAGSSDVEAMRKRIQKVAPPPTTETKEK